jgi:Cu/Zn superoxide dismutase
MKGNNKKEKLTPHNKLDLNSTQTLIREVFLAVFVVLSVILGLTLYFYYKVNSGFEEEIAMMKDVHHLKANIKPYLAVRVKGFIEISDSFDGVNVIGKIEGLVPGSTHYVHVLEYSDLPNLTANKVTKDFLKHFNPTNVRHACPSNSKNENTYHAGDFGNIIANNEGNAFISITRKVSIKSLNGRLIIIGKIADKCEEAMEFDDVNSLLGYGLLNTVKPDVPTPVNSSTDYLMREINSANKKEFDKMNKINYLVKPSKSNILAKPVFYQPVHRVINTPNVISAKKVGYPVSKVKNDFMSNVNSVDKPASIIKNELNSNNNKKEDSLFNHQKFNFDSYKDNKDNNNNNNNNNNNDNNKFNFDRIDDPYELSSGINKKTIVNKNLFDNPIIDNKSTGKTTSILTNDFNPTTTLFNNSPTSKTNPYEHLNLNYPVSSNYNPQQDYISSSPVSTSSSDDYKREEDFENRMKSLLNDLESADKESDLTDESGLSDESDSKKLTTHSDPFAMIETNKNTLPIKGISLSQIQTKHKGNHLINRNKNLLNV